MDTSIICIRNAFVFCTGFSNHIRELHHGTYMTQATCTLCREHLEEERFNVFVENMGVIKTGVSECATHRAQLYLHSTHIHEDLCLHRTFSSYCRSPFQSSNCRPDDNVFHCCSDVRELAAIVEMFLTPPKVYSTNAIHCL